MENQRSLACLLSLRLVPGIEERAELVQKLPVPSRLEPHLIDRSIDRPSSTPPHRGSPGPRRFSASIWAPPWSSLCALFLAKGDPSTVAGASRPTSTDQQSCRRGSSCVFSVTWRGATRMVLGPNHATETATLEGGAFQQSGKGRRREPTAFGTPASFARSETIGCRFDRLPYAFRAGCF